MIEAKGLTKKYGDFIAVDSIDFSVKKGEIFAFLGPNGAGKSTTIKMITTLLHPTGGLLTLNGAEVHKHPEKIRAAIGIVFQDPSLDDDLTALENMELHAALYSVPIELAKKRTEELLQLVELWERKDSFVRTFSGGMKRRLEIARSLLHHPKVLFLDEPTLGLDPQTRNKMWDYVKKLNETENITVFFTTHYMNEAEKIADTIAIIDHGKILTQGTLPELLSKTGKATLEESFLSLTGHVIRAEEASSTDSMRQQRKMWGGNRR